MKKKLLFILTYVFLLTVFLPNYVHAEECTEHQWSKWFTIDEPTNIHTWDDWKTETKSVPKSKAKVSLAKKTVTIQKGKSYTLKIKSKTYGDKTAKWSSSNKKVATVNSKGKVTGKKIGTATITLKMKSGAKSSCKVKVIKAKTNSNKSDSNNNDESNGDDDSSSSEYVWIPKTGSKYHKTSTCSGMKSPSKVTLQEAKKRGYKPCSKCY